MFKYLGFLTLLLCSHANAALITLQSLDIDNSSDNVEPKYLSAASLVSSTNNVPTPDSFALMGSGLLGLVCFDIRRKTKESNKRAK